MIGISSRRGFRVTARKRTEAELAGSDNHCVDCGIVLTDEEIRTIFHLKTSPQCSECGGYDLTEAAYPSVGRMQEQEDFRAWRVADRSTELVH
jgi:hypothetical protein